MWTMVSSNSTWISQIMSFLDWNFLMAPDSGKKSPIPYSTILFVFEQLRLLVFFSLYIYSLTFFYTVVPRQFLQTIAKKPFLFKITFQQTTYHIILWCFLHNNAVLWMKNNLQAFQQIPKENNERRNHHGTMLFRFVCSSII